MEQYIPKDAIVAEIEKRFDEYSSSILKHYDACTEARASELGKILVILNTIKVKEVDLEKELKEDWLFADKTEVDCLESMCLTEDMFVSLAKKYFELGLKAK